MSELKKVGLVAGRGAMPLEIIKSCRERGIEIYVAGLLPFAAESDIDHVPHVMAGLGEVGKMSKFFKQYGVTDIVMAGGIQRPSFKEVIPDMLGAKILARLALRSLSDDNLFRAVLEQVNKLGFNVLGIEDVVPEMMFREGVYGKVKPSSEDMDDIRRGVDVAKLLGAADVGQAVVVQEGIVLAVEAVEGTDRMLERAASLRRKGKAPVMIKIKKPGQDTRVDMPAMGIQTIEKLKAYGMRGMAVEAGGILLIEREEVIKYADKEGIFIIGVEV